MKPQFSQPSAKLQPEQVLHIARLIQKQLGLVYHGDKLPDLERRLNHVLKNLPNEAQKHVISQMLSGNFQQIPDLIHQLTIPETYFLRNMRLFKALKSHILPEIIERKTYLHSLNIWSAGCSSGEEPYSVAILLYELLGDNIPNWNIHLIATDLNEKILEKARQAIYSEWSFRGVPLDFKSRYFINLGNGKFQLKPEIQKLVTFLQHNLIEGPYPPITGIRNFDIIFCRNVLIYMSHTTVQTILERFYRVLDDQGYLITGPSEFPTLKNKKFKPLLLDGTIVYRKALLKNTKHAQAVKPKPFSKRQSAPSPNKPSVSQRPAQVVPKINVPLEIKKNDDKKEKADENVPDALQVIRTLANQGRLQEALELCEQYVKRHALDKNGHYLLGTIYLETGKPREAEIHFQRAIYFDPNFVMAHFALANVYSMTNRCTEAKKYYRNVLTILNEMAPEEPVPESEGMAVKHFKEMVNKLLEAC